MADGDNLSTERTKFNRVYSEDELALFARYVDRRAACRPKACTRGPRCWVALGPPGYTSNRKLKNGACVECGGAPGVHPDDYAR